MENPKTMEGQIMKPEVGNAAKLKPNFLNALPANVF
jgi:hypothetical protein